jgi:tRNA(fMet)-specific endonuclease VapC
MPYLIDSDVLIAHREGEPDAAALLARLAPAGLAISIITYMEVYQGTLRSPDPDRAQASLARFLAGVPVVPLSLAAAQRCAALREDLNRQGKRVRSRALDLMTAAIALEHGYTLVTHNRADYADIPSLALVAP